MIEKWQERLLIDDRERTDEMATNDRFLGIPPRAVPRTIREATNLRAIVSKETRQQLSQADRIKLQTNAERGLEVKYDLLDHVNLSDVETLKAVYNMSIRTEELRSDMARYDIHGVMTILNEVTYDVQQRGLSRHQFGVIMQKTYFGRSIEGEK